ncbi:hypothetical protein Pryu01_00613 [Paraliobacillus ryukyuensis]|uniref:YrhC-like protein n=1 Tax=Paraliobacillus ryukyuensis TaxID=200904 RepID=A0A366EFW4_9BACI|nr:YrhC family protein [Paraliobacillus ryukyuensis]RBP01321.1 YrhC-like protein [Paraliobacillus ryukyuensis]
MQEIVEKKIADYKRFIFVLLILSSYLYAGLLIQVFAHQTLNHIAFILALLAFCLLGSFTLTLRLAKLRIQE